MKNNEIVTGSIADLAQKNNQSIAESFMSCDCIVLIDVSGSMTSEDHFNKSRYDRACDALRNLQGSMQGKIAVVAFSSDARFEPAGIPKFMHGTTGLVKGLQFIKPADMIPDMRFILISDGCPDDPTESLRLAKAFKNRIDVIFVGDESDSQAINFMNQLAEASGGKQVTADSARISETTQLLLKG